MRQLLLFTLSGALLIGCGQQMESWQGPAPAPEERAMVKLPTEDPSSLSPEELRKRAKDASMPGPSHASLQPLAGQWRTEAKWWIKPGAQPEVTQGTASSKWVLGNRFMEQNYTGKMLGEPFKGTQTLGYDNVKQKYVSTWVDSLSTGIMTAEGTYDPGSRAWNMVSKYSCPVTKMEREGRLVTRIMDSNTHIFEMYDKTPDGQEFKALEITYRRKS